MQIISCQVSMKSAGNLICLVHEKDKGNDVLAKQK
jgi:hypothetical protein